MKSVVHEFYAFFDRSWRLLWTGLSFSLFGLGGIVLGLVVFPLLGLLVWNADRRERLARLIISKLFLWFINFMAIFVLRYRIHGQTGREDLSACLITANHPSLIDTVFLLALFPGADCVVKRAHWNNPFTMLAVRFARYIPNNDPQQLMESAVERLRRGRHLVLFPEGTRTEPGGEPVVKRGAAVIALQASADVLPVSIHCHPVTLTKDQPWYAIPEKRVEFDIRLLPQLQASSYLDAYPSLRKASFVMTEDLKTRMLAGIESGKDLEKVA